MTGVHRVLFRSVVNDLDKVKLDDCNVQTPIILVGDTETEFIDFIGVDRFDSIVSSYLVNLYNYIKTKEKNSIWFVYSFDGLQVWKEDQGAQAFEVFVYLEWKISYFKHELEVKFVWNGGGLK